MDHHGLYTDISNSFPGGNGNGGLPNTNVKYHLPQIPPQPPPQQQQQGGTSQQIYLPHQTGSYGGQQQQQQQQVQSGQLLQQQQHVESDPIGCGLFTDTAGLFDPASALCTNNIGSSSYSNNINQGANNSKTVEFTSRKFETNTGDSITYNINNINTNIVNNISGGSLGTGGVQGINQAQAIVGATTDFLGGGAQFATSGGGNGGGSGNTQISFNKDGDSNPTIINISNNNHNIMAPPYPYSYPTKISGMGALNELNSKFGATHSWSTGSGTGTTTVGHEFGHENTVISNFETKNPNKYHTSRSGYQYQQDYTAAQQSQHAAHYQHKQAQPTTPYQPSYGLYHPEGAQATPIHQSNGHHHGYHEQFPHIVRSKYPTTDETNRYGRSHHQHTTTNHAQTHHDLMYNERSRHNANYPTGYVPPTPGTFYTSHQPSTKTTILGPNVDYFNSGYLKQIPTMNHHYLPHNRHSYTTQPTTHHNYHHQNYRINPNQTYEDPYHHRSRVPNIQHHSYDLHAQQQYANYPNVATNLGYPQTQSKQLFNPNKTFADYGAPNVALNPSHHYNNPTTPTVHHQPSHYGGIKYTSQTLVPPMTQPQRSSSSSSQQNPLQKPTQPSNNCYYTTPNPVIDMNHPLIDLEEQINSVKILKTTNRDPQIATQSYNTNHAINYDCHQKYMMNRYLSSKTTPSHIPDANGYIPNGLITSNGHITANPTNFGYTTMEDLGLGARGFTLDENLKDKNLRDYLSSWNETEEEEEKKEANNNQTAHQNFESCKYLQEALEEQLPPLPHSGVIVANVQNTNLPDILVDLDKPKDDPQLPPPKTGQEQTEVGERLYILETYDVPHSELNKYKHLSVINELPKNVVPIHDSADSLKFLEEIESNRDKYYQTELESEVVYDDRKKEDDKKDDQTVPEAPTKLTPEPIKEEPFKVPLHLPKYRKRRHVEPTPPPPQYDYPRFPKRARRSSIEDFLHCSDKPMRALPKVVPLARRYNARSLLTLCVAALNSREYRRYAKANIARREQKEKLERERMEEAKKKTEEVVEVAPMEVEEACKETETVIDLTDSQEETPAEEVQERQEETAAMEVQVRQEETAAEEVQERQEETAAEELQEETAAMEMQVRQEETATEELQEETAAMEMQVRQEETAAEEIEELEVVPREEQPTVEEEQSTIEEEQSTLENEEPNVEEEHQNCKEQQSIIEEEQTTEKTTKEDDVAEATDVLETETATDVAQSEKICEEEDVITDERSTPEVEQSDEDDDVFEEPAVTNRVSVIEETRQPSPPLNSIQEEACPSPVPEPVTEGQRVPVIQRLESVEVIETKEEVKYNPQTLRQLASEAFERYSQVYDYQRVPPLRTLCYEYLMANDALPQPDSLQKLCEQFICSNRQLFIIEEVRQEPERLQDMCQKVLNETNIIIDMNDFCIMTNEEMEKQDREEEGRVFIVEDNHGSIVDLLRDDDEDDTETEVMEISEDHEIFLEAMETADHGIRVVLESNHSDSENEIYRKVEQEIEKMMTTSSDEDDEAVDVGVTTVQAMDEQELQNEFFSFVGDDCIQYEEVVPVNKVAYRRESLINDLRERYVGSKEGTFSCRLKLLRKYVYYQRYIKLKDQKVASKQRFFRKRLLCLEKKIAAIRRKIVVEPDSDSNSSMSSVSSSSSSSSSASSSGTSSSSSSDSEEVVTEVETFEQSGESGSEETSNQSVEPIETNNNQVVELPKPAQIESLQYAKEEDSNSSDSRSRGQLRRSPNVLPFAKKKKLSFEESLLNIEQIYKKTNSPAPSSIGSPNSSNSSSSNSNSRMSRRFSTNCRPNVIVNVNNNREAPRKLFIPSYKIFDQTMSAKLQMPTEVVPSRSLSRSSSGSSSSGSSSAVSTKQVTSTTQRSSGLIRVNYPKKPTAITTTKEEKIPPKPFNSRSRAPPTVTNGQPDLDHRVPFVRLERIDYVEKLAEQYRQQQQQQDQQTKFNKLRQRRKSTFS